MRDITVGEVQAVLAKHGLRVVTSQFIDGDYARLVRENCELRAELQELRRERVERILGRGFTL